MTEKTWKMTKNIWKKTEIFKKKWPISIGNRPKIQENRPTWIEIWPKIFESIPKYVLERGWKYLPSELLLKNLQKDENWSGPNPTKIIIPENFQFS